MDSQQFYNPNAVKPAPRYFSSQFRPFNHEPKPVSKLGKKISLGAKITQATGGSGAHAREEPRMKMAASPAEDTHLHDTVRVETPGMRNSWSLALFATDLTKNFRRLPQIPIVKRMITAAIILPL